MNIDCSLSPCAKEVMDMHCMLGLYRNIVGVTFFTDQYDYDQSSVQAIKTPLSYCSIVRMASLRYARKGTAEHVSCPGARRALGLTPPNEEYLSGRRYMSLGMYRDIKCAREVSAQVGLMSESIYGFATQPLATCVVPPHVVVVICNPNQAMRMLQGYIHGHGVIPAIKCMGMQGVCSELTVRPFQSKSINVSMLCSNTRYTCSWLDSEMGVGMPYSMLCEVVEGVAATLNAAESDRAKQAIAQRAVEMNTDMSVRAETAYYLQPLIKNTGVEG